MSNIRFLHGQRGGHRRLMLATNTHYSVESRERPTHPMSTGPTTIGWREWAHLPDLGVREMKVKVDTGADNSALHAFDLERFDRDDEEWVRFVIHPKQRSKKPMIRCEAPIITERKVRNPGGRLELRPVIRTRLIVAGKEISALINLTTRDEMSFRMLLGRRTIRKHFLVDPGKSYLGGRPSSQVD